MKPLRDSLKDWTDIDGAQFELARRLGLINEEASFQDTKHLWWTDNPVGNAMADLLEEMEDAGLVECRHEPDHQYRWILKPLKSLAESAPKAREPEIMSMSADALRAVAPDPALMTDEELKAAVHEAVHAWQALAAESEARSERRAAEKERERRKALEASGACPACDGEGWLWGHELISLSHHEDHGDQRYSCDRCGGSGMRKREQDDLDAFIADRAERSPGFPGMVEAAEADRRAREEEKETIPHQYGCQGPGGCRPGCPHEDDPHA
jgi:hypothetical protein